MSFVQELKRRNVLRVAAAYIAFSWLVLQVAETLFPIFGISSTVLRVVVIALVVGFVPAVIAAWLLEITPDGLRFDDGEERDPGFSRRIRDRLNSVVIVSLLLAVSYFAVDKFITTEEPQVESGEISVAVLPFIYHSSSDDMAFFSDGVAEDILGQLSRTKGLRSIARSSSFSLRDPSITAADVGARLGVDYMLTGTFQHHEERVRIRVRLEDTETETLVWSAEYDRDLIDIFSVQADISRQVVNAVAPQLTAYKATAADPSPQHYIDYLRARHVYLKGRNNFEEVVVLEAKELFEALVRDNPDYARAHAGLADVWSFLSILGSVSDQEGYSRAKSYAERALQLDPENGEAWFALGDIRVESDYDLPAAEDAYMRALEIAPNDADGLRGYAYFLRQAGRFDDALAAYDRSLQVDPSSDRAYQGIYATYVRALRFTDAEAMLEAAAEFDPSFPIEAIKAWIYSARGEFDLLAEALPQVHEVLSPRQAIFFQAVAERGQANQPAGDETIHRLLAEDIRSSYLVAQYFAKFGDFDRAIEFLERAAVEREVGLAEAVTEPDFAKLRDDPRFRRWVNRAGIKTLR